MALGACLTLLLDCRKGKHQWRHYMGVGPGAKKKMGPLPQSDDVCMGSAGRGRVGSPP